MVTLQIQQLRLPPGQRILVDRLNWSDFETLLDEMGDRRSSRIAYSKGTLEIIAPLPEHEVAKENIGDLIKALLEGFNIEFVSLGSTTFKHELMKQGIEPDQCFYIQHEASIRGKDRLDLSVDPPPDLALEIDVTSRTHPDIYRSLGVPELWRFEKGQLQINCLIQGQYQEMDKSPIFPNLPLRSIIPSSVQQMKQSGRNQAMKAFRAWIVAQSATN